MYYFDAHCDFLWNSIRKKETALTDEADCVGLKKSVFAVFEGADARRQDIDAQLKRFKEPKPIENTYLAFEGLSWVKSLHDAEKIIACKPVYASPVWNTANAFGGSCHEDGEVTAFGKCFLRELDENGVVIDLAHSGERMFYSVLDECKNVIFSHGNVNAIHENIRNLKREQILRLIERDSFFGLSFYTEFVGGTGIAKLFEHIEYVLDLGGENILGFGSDLDGCDDIVENRGVRVFEALSEEFIKRNYPSKLIEKIAHANLENTLKCC